MDVKRTLLATIPTQYQFKTCRANCTTKEFLTSTIPGRGRWAWHGYVGHAYELVNKKWRRERGETVCLAETSTRKL